MELIDDTIIMESPTLTLFMSIVHGMPATDSL